MGRKSAPKLSRQIVDKIAALPTGTRVYILSPLVLRNNEDYPAAFQRLQKEGYARLEINGEIVPLDKTPKIGKNIKHDVKIVVDRMALDPEEQGRLSEAVEISLNQSNGVVVLKTDDPAFAPIFFSIHSACLSCEISFPELTPRHFSFNSPLGQCPQCEGIGTFYGGRRSLSRSATVRVSSLSRVTCTDLPAKP